jgi:hypothetical protein
MAYDLILRLTSQDWSRMEPMTALPPGPNRDGPRMIAISGLSLLGLLAWSLPKVNRAWERTRYRQKFTRDDLHVTRKMPAVTMHNLVYGNKK